MAKPLTSGAEHTGNRQSEDAFERLRLLEEMLNRAPWARARLLIDEPGAKVPNQGLSFSSGITRAIPHGLGRPARGFLEVYVPGVASVTHVGLFPVAFSPATPAETHLSVQASFNGTCAILVW